MIKTQKSAHPKIFVIKDQNLTDCDPLRVRISSVSTLHPGRKNSNLSPVI